MMVKLRIFQQHAGEASEEQEENNVAGAQGNGAEPEPHELVKSLSLQDGSTDDNERMPREDQLRKPEYLECPLNWLEFLKCGRNVLNRTTKNFVIEWVDLSEKQLSKVLRDEPMHYFLMKLLQVMYMVHSDTTGDAKQACLILNKLTKTAVALDEERFSSDYKNGLMNMLGSMKQELKLQYGVIIGPRCSANVEPVMLKQLPDAAKCPILAAKVYFCKIAGGALTYQQYLTKMILDYDPNTAEWYYIHHSVLRAIRHQDEVRYRHRPDAFELQALGKAYTLDPANQEIQASVLKTLFDCLKQKRTFYTEIGNLVFNTRESIEDYLCSTVSDAVVSGKDASVRALLAASQVIGYYRLPEGKRNISLSEELLKKASDLWPTSSKILSRAGNWLLSEKKDFKGAKEKFLEAITQDPSDAVSTINYFWLDSARTKLENIPRINEILKSEAASQWPSHVQLDMCFLKGCIYISVGQMKEGLTEWSNGEAFSPRYFLNKMFMVNHMLRKYSWRMKSDEEEGKFVPVTGSFVEKSVRDYLDQIPEEEPEDITFHRLADVLKIVQKARAKPEDEEVPVDGVIVAKGSSERKPSDESNWRSSKNRDDSNVNSSREKPQFPTRIQYENRQRSGADDQSGRGRRGNQRGRGGRSDNGNGGKSEHGGGRPYDRNGEGRNEAKSVDKAEETFQKATPQDEEEEW